jgi:3-deoxy-7-phosphoheptulonate synthase
MIIVMQPNTRKEEIEKLSSKLQTLDIKSENISKFVGQQKVILALMGDTTNIDSQSIQSLSSSIEHVERIKKPFKQASLEFRYGEYSEVVVSTPNGTVPFGKNHPVVVVAGPCSVENEEMIVQTAIDVKAGGAQFLRGGAYKPRTSPYAFQGHGESALGLLAYAREATGLGIITEVMDSADLNKVAEVADVIQVGARNMQNFSLLKKVGAVGKPVLLKRGLSATIEEWLMAAEYILAMGNPNVILCERGVRSFDNRYTRNILDLSVIPVLRSLTHLPIMIDPSHGTGYSELVPSMTMAAIAAGTDSLMIEVHPNPRCALSDGPQSLTPVEFTELMQDVKSLSKFFSRGQKLPFATAQFATKSRLTTGV